MLQLLQATESDVLISLHYDSVFSRNNVHSTVLYKQWDDSVKCELLLERVLSRPCHGQARYGVDAVFLEKRTILGKYAAEFVFFFFFFFFFFLLRKRTREKGKKEEDAASLKERNVNDDLYGTRVVYLAARVRGIKRDLSWERHKCRVIQRCFQRQCANVESLNARFFVLRNL